MRSNERRGPGPGLLLLIPIGLLIAKGVGRRRRTLEAGGGRGRHGGFGHGGFGHGGFGPGAFDAEGRSTFTLPPKIESVLDAWHTRVHENVAETEAAPPKGAGTATV
jgi:hypothetical protein